MQEAFWIGGQMKIKWERNSRVLELAAQGKIKDEDIISRTTTDKFPAEAATVRLAKVNEKNPFVTVHIRGKSQKRKYTLYGGATAPAQTYECAETCRVNLGGSYDGGMCSNGNLDEDLSWLDVHNVVEEVKETMGV